MHVHNVLKPAFVLFFLSLSLVSVSQTLLATPQVNSVLFTGKGRNQPLIVGLGGSEGGNAWAGDYWRKIRDQFIDQGYAFLAIGYFGVAGTPDTLQQISIDAIHLAIAEATKNPFIQKGKIAIIGGSRGGDLALLLGSFYPDISCVVAIVPSHVSFPGNTSHFSTSSWSFHQEELPFVPVNEEAVPFLMKGDLRGTFEAMLKDSIAEQNALIRVEQIHGSVLLISASQDEICPSTPMCEKMMRRLKNRNFSYPSEHIIIAGGHAAPLSHFDLVFRFLDTHYPARP